ncbi:MAG TPA: tripartite tricarboxylate transporter TctB family protein [Burkholderiales bacterium]|nr:tripartite tricarboxylate transporter TctB family protein [Burkholderiales bacterium]
MQQPRLTPEVWSGAVLAGLGVFIVMQALGWDYMSVEGPGPGFFPLWYGILMIVLSLALAVSGAMQRCENAAKSLAWRGLGRALIVWIAFAVCVALLQVLGFVVAFGLLVLFIVAVIYRRPLRTALAVATGTAIGFYLVFPVALNVELPAGLFGF